MGILRKTLSASLLGASAGVTYLCATTTLVAPLPQSDPLWRSKTLCQLNVYQNPVMSDSCSRRIPLSKIRPELRDDEAALTTAFCGAVWSGWAYTPQRALLTHLFHSPEKADQLFSQQQLAASKYELGTQITDHFQVVARSRNEILARGGASPSDVRPRELDAVMATRARIDKEAGEVEVSLATAMFNSKDRVTSGKPPITYPMELLHRLYARALVLNGSQALR